MVLKLYDYGEVVTASGHWMKTCTFTRFPIETVEILFAGLLKKDLLHVIYHEDQWPLQGLLKTVDILWIGVEIFSRSSMDRRYFRGFCAPDTFPRASMDRRVFQGLLWTENLFNDFYGPNNFSRSLDRILFQGPLSSIYGRTFQSLL